MHEKGFGVFQRYLGHFLEQLTADSLLHPAHSWPWEELTGSGGNPWGLCKYKGLISASCYFGSSGLGGGFHLSTCSLVAEIILAVTEKNIITVIYLTSFALLALKCLGEVASIPGRGLSCSPRAAMPFLGCPACCNYLSLLESLDDSWHLPFDGRAAPPLQHIPSHYCPVGSLLCCGFP